MDDSKLSVQSVCLRLLCSGLLALCCFNIAHAFLPPDPGGGGGGNSGGTPGSKCLENTVFSFTATPETIEPGGTATLSWSIRPPQGCNLFNRVTLNGQSYGLIGSAVVQPSATTDYPLTLIVPGGFKTVGPVTIKVNLPKTVYINGSTSDWRNVLLQALGEENTKVVLAPAVDMDLSGLNGIAIAANVTLTSELPPVNAPPNAPALARLPDVTPRSLARDARNLGPRLYTNTRPDYLFNIAGDNVKLEGFRLQGPDFEPSDGEARAIVINSRKGVEISNMEFSGWSLVAVYIKDPDFRIHSAYPVRIRDNPNAVRVHDSFFHHNQHKPGGNGYGIEVKEGAQALIERNVFDFNRHAIAAGSEPATGYVAQQNLVLEGGGVHCINNTAGLLCGHTHQFDVHGSDNCVPFRFLDDKWNCGSAGEEFHFTANAFQYTKDHAIDLRGYPSIAAVVSNNVFAHGSVSDAVRQRLENRPVGGVLMQVEANTANVHTAGEYGVCDFDGDGRDDLFLATGVSWWYLSSAKMHWTFLNAHPERLQDVKLGDFNGDHRCDVFTVHGDSWDVSSGGTDIWRSLGNIGVPFSELQVGDFNGDGIKDFFRRAPDGQWYTVSPGYYGWTALQSSSFPLSDLRFGDFNDDRVTDVIALQGGHWSISWGGNTAWEKLNGLDSNLHSVLIADIDHNGSDEILRYRAINASVGRWEVSWDGRSGWNTLDTLSWPANPGLPFPAASVRGFVGRFRSADGADLLSVDYSRMGRIFDITEDKFVGHSLYAY